MELNRLTDMVLGLLLYDNEAANLIRAVLEPQWLESDIHRELTEAAYEYIDKYHEVPGVHDMDILGGFDDTTVVMARLVIGTLRDLYANGINKQYVIDNLQQFVRSKQIRRALHEALQHDQANELEQVEDVLSTALKKRFEVFSPGLYLKEFIKVDFEAFDEDVIYLGIKPLDDVMQVPHRKEMYMFIAPAKKGKSWGLTHVGKCAILQQKRVLHISLEMSEERVIRRYLQSLCAYTTRPENVRVTEIETDGLGRLMGLNPSEIGERPTIREGDRILAKINGLRIGERLLIKAFPTGTLTMSGLRGYISALEASTGFVPDVIILDYPDLMALPKREQLRIELGELYRELRGIAVEHNAFLIVASQSNREGAKSGLVKDTNVAEDFSRIATTDIALTYNQTSAEHALGVARLFLSNGRNDADKFEVLITQSYAMGQFAIDSVRVPADYEALIKQTQPFE